MRTKMLLGLLALAMGVALPGCSLPNPISALNGDYYHVSGGTNLYVTIKRNATEEIFYAQFVCMLNGGAPLDCARDILAVTAATVATNMEDNAAVKWLWDNRIRHAFAADEAADFYDALSNLQGRGHECLRISIRSGENWTTVDSSLAECSWGRDPFPGNGI